MGGLCAPLRDDCMELFAVEGYLSALIKNLQLIIGGCKYEFK